MSAAETVDVRAALAAPDLPARVDALGFDPADARDVLAAAGAVLGQPDRLAAVQTAADRLAARVGVLPPTHGDGVWADLPADEAGVLPMLALLATAPVVAARHAGLDVPPEVSAATLADLGQQVRVNRLVNGTFGLATHAWESGYVWSGALFRLGRLQFDLEPVPTVDGSGQEWVLSTHIPRGTRLAPEDVDASLAAARPFFAERFPDHQPVDLYCRSWMLDPRLPTLLPGSNLAAFQQRWRTYGEPLVGDQDAWFFGFAGRGSFDAVDVDELHAETALQRAVLSVWRSGGHWQLVDGRLAS